MKKAVRFLRRMAPYVPGAYWVKGKLTQVHPTRAPITRPSRRSSPKPVDEGRLRAEYDQSPMAEMPDTFVLYRIVGNDLVPRHRKGQSRENLAFILDHEPEFEDCEKRFVVNRIVDSDEEAAVIDLLRSHGREFVHLPFDRERFRAIGWDIAGVPPKYSPHTWRHHRLRADAQGRVRMRFNRFRNNAVMNNNGARNVALEDGRGRAKWILPFDGSCFFNRAAWEALRDGVVSRPHYPYHVVPMARLLDNRDMLDDGFSPEAGEEPQIAFRQDAGETFDPEFFYGRRPKVELLWRLGVSGPWDQWPIEPWDLDTPPYCDDAGRFVWSGWVARLYSGQRRLEKAGGTDALVDRGLARVDAIEALLTRLDEAAAPPTLRDACVFVESARGEPLPEPLAGALRAAAEEAMSRGPHSVMQKTTLAPSGDLRDYWHPAPYFWPHPLGRLGFPDVSKDGVRVPGTRLYEPSSEQFDRTRLQRTFDDSFVLTLAYRETGEWRFAEHAAALIRSWFIDPETAMNPSLDYAQVRRGHNRSRGSSSGIIEMKDLYFLLDGARMLEACGALEIREGQSLRAWLARYLDWLQTSPQGVGERATPNNHGIYYDLQVGSIAAYLGDDRLVRLTVRDSMCRIAQQFAPDGSQPEELERSTTAHYCAFNLQGWITQVALADAAGEDLWSFVGAEGQSIPGAVRWLMGHMGKPWPFEQIDEFDDDRFLPIYFDYVDRMGERPCGAVVPPREEIKPVFHPHDGIRPFWQVR